MCVQDINVQCVLQFTLIHAAGCALHRHTSRVIHRLEFYFHEVFTDGLRSARRSLRPSGRFASEREEKRKSDGAAEARLFKPGKRSSRPSQTACEEPRYPRPNGVCHGHNQLAPGRRNETPAAETKRNDALGALLPPKFGNDPSAGSPTETLLRLLLPLDDQVRSSSRRRGPAVARQARTNPRISLNHPIGSSDGRCVQRAGT